MMIKIAEKIDNLTDSGRTGFMGHVIAGYPDYKSSLDAALGICAGGADFIEVQFPFSDPTADGPVIEGACYTSLENGFKVIDGFKLIGELTKKTKASVLIMTYANIVYKYGIKEFVNKAKEAGASGLIIPDIPVENDEGLSGIARKAGIDIILIATPGSSAERVRALSEKGSGFLYTVARRGITGKKTEFDREAKEWFKLVKKNSKLPVAIGFGIRTREQIKELKDYCSIAIMGSYLVTVIKDAFDKKKKISEVLKNTVSKLIY